MMMADLNAEISQLRNQGLTEDVIEEELVQRGYPENQVKEALDQPSVSASMDMGLSGGAFSSMQSSPSAAGQDDVYGRIEEIAEGIIDEKWDELITEVRKILQWKEKIETSQRKMEMDVAKLKEDFNILHQGVLGKLEDYDTRMRDVGTELKAVGKVFQDTVPEFVQNVKDLSNLTNKIKK